MMNKKLLTFSPGGSPTVPGGSPTVPGGSPTVPGGSPTVPGRGNLVDIFEYPDISEILSDDNDFVLEVHENSAIYFPGKSIYGDENLHIGSGENNIPHWELDSTIYHVCFRLNDSVPVQKQQEWLQERESLMGIAIREKRELTEDEKKRLQYLYSDKIESYLDTGYGECLLRIPQVAQIVKDSLVFYNDRKYILHSWCIMPNHLHVAFQLLDHYGLSEVLHGWKSFTAHSINQSLGRQGTLWQHDFYNHIIRSENEYYRQIRYIWDNPDKAGFTNWQWRWMTD